MSVDGLLDRLGWDRVAVAKIDVEGAEGGVFRGMARLLSRPDAPVLLYEVNTHALRFFGHTRADLLGALERHGYRTYTVEKRRLIPTDMDAFEPRNTVNCLAVKGQPPTIAGWQVTGPRSFDESIRAAIDESRSPRAFDRAHVARAVAHADPAMLSHPKVSRMLRRLAHDADPSVRHAAAWSLASDRPTRCGRLIWS